MGTLSGGERRLVELLLVLALDRPFVLLDEPFSGIEPIYVELIQNELRRNKNKAFLITDHNYRDVRTVCSRCMSLRNGQSNTVEVSDDALRREGYLPT